MYAAFRSAECDLLVRTSILLRKCGIIQQTRHYSVKGKVGIVTGGAGGIGLAYTKELLKKGAKGIAIGDLRSEKEALEEITKEVGSNNAIFVKTDVINKSELEALFQATIKKWNKVDIVINNAGIINDDNWKEEIQINVVALVRGTYLGLKHMSIDKGGKGGVIVNVASTYGIQPFPGTPIYVGTKHFVVGFSRSLGDLVHYKRTGVRILTLCPGASVSTENAAAGMAYLLKKGESGSVWVVEGKDSIYEVTIPDLKDIIKK